MILTATTAFAAEPAPPDAARFRVPPGFSVECVAAAPLVKYPLFACFDDQGRLYVAEGTGTNLPGEELVKIKRGRILRLEDTDGDGTFDESKVFADELVFPQGVLWHDGALYTCSHPSIWRLEDTNDDGRADKREAFISHFRFTGNGCDIHGPFLGPDGRIYWADGRHGYTIKTAEGPTLEGFAACICRCKTDGTQIERLCGGGFDNPVEVVFMPDGELVGTMDQGPGDALLHYVEGGVYPMDHPCVSEFKMTGPMLPPISQYTAALPVALCGMARYEGSQFGGDYAGSLFTAQFNVHRVQQHLLSPQGSTYSCVHKDFVTTLDYDVHLTDVLEDADGSLLFVDMGAWFNYGCPTSKIAKPEVLGAIYRVRREASPAVKDPWGIDLEAGKKPVDWIALLDDARPKVREKAIARLAKRGDENVPALAAVLQSERSSVLARQNAVWALCRIDGMASQAAVRTALIDKEPAVRQAAIHSVGLFADTAAISALSTIVVEDTPPLRRKAAEALGRIRSADGVPAIVESLRRGVPDRHVEHALIYALIRINDRSATLTALADPNPRVRQAGLIGLDQMDDGQLTRELVVPLLDTDDADLQQAALAVMSRRTGWSDDTLGLLRQWVAAGKLSPEQEQSLTGVLLAYCGEEPIQKLVTETLSKPGSVELHSALLRVIARCRLDPLPESWLAALGDALRAVEPAVRREAVSAIKSRGLPQFDAVLVDLSRQAAAPVELRVAALDCAAPRLKAVDAETFGLLTDQLSDSAEQLVRVAAARTLGASTLNTAQLSALAGHIAQSGPIVAPLLATAYSKATDPSSGLALIEALERSPGAEALTADDLDRLLQGFPANVQERSLALRRRLATRQQEQAVYLTQLMQELLQTPGSADRGREAFFAKKVGCAACHRTASKGGQIGPDLSKVGQFRTARDLLESIVYPSSAIVPQFRSVIVTAKDGRVLTGMIVRETSDAIYLRTPQLAELRVATHDIEEMSPSKVSIMPEGLEKTMTRQEMSDLLEFLYQQR